MWDVILRNDWLHFACCRGDENLTHEAIRLGADLNYARNYSTPLQASHSRLMIYLPLKENKFLVFKV